MIFQHTHEIVIAGLKTQTRRIVQQRDITSGVYDRDGYRLVETGGHVRDGVPYKIRHRDRPFTVGRKWIPGRIYAVQPGRAQKAVAYIRVTGVRKEDVRNISLEDVVAEGFATKTQFWAAWCLMHDPDAASDMHYCRRAHDAYQMLAQRPRDRYQAWVIEFELVEEGTGVKTCEEI